MTESEERSAMASGRNGDAKAGQEGTPGGDDGRSIPVPTQDPPSRVAEPGR